MYFNKKIFKDDIIEAMKIIKVVIKYWWLKIVIAISIPTIPYYLGKYYNTLRYGSEYPPDAFTLWAYGIKVLFMVAALNLSLWLFVCLLGDAYKRYFKKPLANNNRLDGEGEKA